MPPSIPSSGYIISKLGVQATARADKVTGLICLKLPGAVTSCTCRVADVVERRSHQVSIPREGEGRQVSRYSLFTGNNPPKILSPPEVHPLPYPTTPPTPGVRIASRLLGLGTSYPPSQAVSGFKPIIDISSTTGQVFLVLDPRRSSPSKRDSPGGGRRDWLIILHFETGVERCIERGSQQVRLGLPKCLDNVIRFQILTPSAASSHFPMGASSGDISIIAEPKVLPVAPDSFSTSPLKSRHRARSGRGRRVVGADEGWEDGEDMGPEEDYESEESDPAGESASDSGDEDGSWLEGRFLSTETLRLEWSFGGASTSSSLLITPIYDTRAPTIHVSYETAISAPVSVVPIETVIPDGWGWRDLSIRGEGLISWRSFDGDWWDVAPAAITQHSPAPADQSADASAFDDSFSTVRQRRKNTPSRGHATPTHNANPAASLLRQTLPSMGNMEEYSFEMSNTSIETTKPFTPAPVSVSTNMATPKRSTASPSQLAGSTPGSTLSEVDVDSYTCKPIRGPAPARLFDLEYEESGGTMLLEGTLVPLSRATLVSTGLSLPVPYVRIERQDEDENLISEVHCPGRLAGHNAEVNVGAGNAGSFRWTDGESRVLPDQKAFLGGDVDVRMIKDVWGGVTINMSFEWPKRAKEVGWRVPSSTVRVTRTAMRNIPLSWAMSEIDGEMEIRIGRGERAGGGGGGRADGRVEVTYETRLEEGVVPVPATDGDGRMTVYLKGDWSESQWCRAVCSGLIAAIDDACTQTNMTPLKAADGHAYTYDLFSPSRPSLVIAPPNSKSTSTSSSRTSRGARGLLSWTTLATLFMLYLIMSLAQRVDRFRAEVSFVANEIKDLREYGVGDIAALKSALVEAASASASASALTTSAVGRPVPSTSMAGTRLFEHAATGQTGQSSDRAGQVMPHRKNGHGSGEMSTSLGRVVFGRSAWDKWAAHPTMQSIGRGLSWVWHAVVWLVVAPP